MFPEPQKLVEFCKTCNNTGRVKYPQADTLPYREKMCPDCYQGRQDVYIAACKRAFTTHRAGENHERNCQECQAEIRRRLSHDQ